MPGDRLGEEDRAWDDGDAAWVPSSWMPPADPRVSQGEMVCLADKAAASGGGS
jgi:hypothetical protein